MPQTRKLSESTNWIEMVINRIVNWDLKKNFPKPPSECHFSNGIYYCSNPGVIYTTHDTPK